MRLRTERFIKRILKWVIAGAFLFFFFNPEYIKRPIYQRFFAKPYEKQLNVWEKDVFKDLGDEQRKPFSKEYNKINITFVPKKAYEVTARIGILERYDTLWERFAHGYDDNRKIYNSFSPIDLALVHGNSAYHEKFNSCFKHEYRLLWSCPEISQDYFNNYHIIPANDNLRKGLETLHNGDIVYVKGVLVNVKVPGWFEMKTGTSHNMTHKDQFAGGQYTGMCFILYLREMPANGYIYK